MKTVRFAGAGGTISIRLKSGYMQPAVVSLLLWARDDTKPMELGGGILVDGNPTIISPVMDPMEYDDKIVQAVVTLSLVNGRRYAPEVHIDQNESEIGSDGVDMSTQRHSIGVQFLFLMKSL